LVAVVVAIGAVGVVLGVARSHDTDRLRPVGPPPGPSATHGPVPSSGHPSSSTAGPGSSRPGGSDSASRGASNSAAATSLGQIDWRNSVMNLPTNDICPHTRVQFTKGAAAPAPWHYTIAPHAEPVYGDVNQDGRTDAVVVITCYGSATVGGPETRFMIIAFTGNAKGGPTPIGFVDGMQAYVDPAPSLRDGGRTVVVDWRPSAGGSLVRTYRWNGTKFELAR
jgi:hypothetical protein